MDLPPQRLTSLFTNNRFTFGEMKLRDLETLNSQSTLTSLFINTGFASIKVKFNIYKWVYPAGVVHYL